MEDEVPLPVPLGSEYDPGGAGAVLPVRPPSTSSPPVRHSAEMTTKSEGPPKVSHRLNKSCLEVNGIGMDSNDMGETRRTELEDGRPYKCVGIPR